MYVRQPLASLFHIEKPTQHVVQVCDSIMGAQKHACTLTHDPHIPAFSGVCSWRSSLGLKHADAGMLLLLFSSRVLLEIIGQTDSAPDDHALLHTKRTVTNKPSSGGRFYFSHAPVRVSYEPTIPACRPQWEQ